MHATAYSKYVIDRVREKRLAKGVSWENYKIALGFESKGYISKIESKSYDDHYTIDQLNEIAKTLQCSSWEFRKTVVD